VPGDIIVIYGVGFGPVTPDIPAGQLVGEANSLATDFHIFIGGMECGVQYDGLAPSYTGLYQFNIVVPTVASGNAAADVHRGRRQRGADALYRYRTVIGGKYGRA
jgi:uncharacterized protein (TIGR03437 family)